MADNDDRLSSPPPGEDWVAPNTLAGDLTLTAEQYLERVSSIPSEPVIVPSKPSDPLEPGPDGIIPGNALHDVLESIQAKLDRVLGNQDLVWEEIGQLHSGLDQVKQISQGAKEIVTKLADDSIAQHSMATSLRDQMNQLDKRLTCPQPQCMVKRVIGDAMSGNGASGE